MAFPERVFHNYYVCIPWLPRFNTQQRRFTRINDNVPENLIIYISLWSSLVVIGLVITVIELNCISGIHPSPFAFMNLIPVYEELKTYLLTQIIVQLHRSRIPLEIITVNSRPSVNSNPKVNCDVHKSPRTTCCCLQLMNQVHAFPVYFPNTVLV